MTRNSTKIVCVALALSVLTCGFSAAQSPQPSGGSVSTVKEACAADRAKFCPDAQDAQSRIACMNAHRVELSEECRAARQAAGRNGQGANGGLQNSTPSEPSASSTPATTAAPSAGQVTPGEGLNTVTARIMGRSFPSVFAPWQFGPNRPAPNQAGGSPGNDSRLPLIAHHDLYWNNWNALGLKLAGGQTYPLLSPQFAPESIEAARKRRAELLAANPNIIILSDIDYRAARPDFLPPDSPYWLRDTTFEQQGNGKRYGRRRLNIADPGLQDHVAAFCAALIRTGIYDGCMLDIWHEETPETARDSVALIRKIRVAAGDQAILIGNVNGRLPVYTAPYLNGMYMEGFGARYFSDWRTAAGNLLWGETHLHKPAITALEGWWQTTGRGDLPLMRQVTTLAMVFSNGYVLFGDPNGPPDHLHDWYPFWDKSLGKPVDPLAMLDRPNLSGAYSRKYERGEVVFNPPSNHRVTVDFKEWRRSAATNAVGKTFTIAPGDGDLFLTVN